MSLQPTSLRVVHGLALVWWILAPDQGRWVSASSPSALTSLPSIGKKPRITVRTGSSLWTFASQLGFASFDLVFAVEVIEHVESPINFLRNIAQLLAPEGVAIITTPNVDSLPARAKFLLAGKLRIMDEHSDPSHISPIFYDLLCRQFLPQSGLRIPEHLLFPPHGYQLSRKPIAWTLSIAATAFGGGTLLGDHHVLVLWGIN